jgi:hypothetical protein
MIDQRIIAAIQTAPLANELRLFQRGRSWIARIHITDGFWAEGHGPTAELALLALAERVEEK